MAFRRSGISSASITIVWPSVSRAHPMAANSSLENHLRMWHCRKLASHFSLSACAVPVARNSAATPVRNSFFISSLNGCRSHRAPIRRECTAIRVVSGEVAERRPQHCAALLWACCRCRNGPHVEAVSFFKGISGGSNFNVGETVWSFVSGVWFVCEHQGVNLVLIALMPRIFLRIGREGRSRYDFCGSVFRLLDDFERPALNDGAIHIHRAQELELHFLASKCIAHVFHFLHAAGLFLFGPLFCRRYGR